MRHAQVRTTLRLTQLPYQELYDYDKCAKFVADFRYEPLELSWQIPRHLPSPAATLGWQAGDCFDCAQALCSLLLGVGYGVRGRGVRAARDHAV